FWATGVGATSGFEGNAIVRGRNARENKSAKRKVAYRVGGAPAGASATATPLGAAAALAASRTLAAMDKAGVATVRPAAPVIGRVGVVVTVTCRAARPAVASSRR